MNELTINFNYYNTNNIIPLNSNSLNVIYSEIELDHKYKRNEENITFIGISNRKSEIWF